MVVCRLLDAQVSLAAEHRLQVLGFSSCGTWAWLSRGVCVLVPRPEIEPVSPALAGRFPATGPRGEAPQFSFSVCVCLKMHITKFTMLTVFKYTVQWCQIVFTIVVQPSLPSIPLTLFLL